jgi:hypothetical protein
MGHGRAIINIEDIQTDIYQNSESKPVRSRYGSFSKNYQESLKPKPGSKQRHRQHLKFKTQKVLLIILEAK